MLEYLGLPYVDKKYTDPNEWFGVDKVAYKDDPLVNIPYIKDGGKVIFQSPALPLYLVGKSRRNEMLGKTVEEQVFVAQGDSLSQDLFAAFVGGVLYGPKE